MTKRRVLVIAAWLLLAAGLAPLQGPLQERAADESRTFEARGAPSARAADLLEQRFSERGASVAVIVYHDPSRRVLWWQTARSLAYRTATRVPVVGGTKWSSVRGAERSAAR